MRIRPARLLLLSIVSSAATSLAAPAARGEDAGEGTDPQEAREGGEPDDEEADEAPAGKPRTAKPPESDEPETTEPLPEPVPPARDLLGGHLVLGLGAAWTTPSGDLADGVAATTRAGDGYSLALDAGLGVSRNVVLGLWAAYGSHGAAEACRECSGVTMSGGAFVRYHLVQGVRFDPWMLAGVGFTSATYDSPAGDLSYSGPEWLRLAVGGDWYAWSGLGFGPWLEASADSFTSRPAGESGSPIHWTYRAGARIVFDTPGK
ncbi:MAG: hypothetical protein IT376_07935 [Polyangiaceae bacterium]|nr:hypothetical protein [Polyangiaceae bacterium]